MHLRDLFPWAARKDSDRPGLLDSTRPDAPKGPSRKALLVGAAVASLAGVTAWAAAEINKTHRIDVQLADGSRAHIVYVGDTPPTVRIGPASIALSRASAPPGLFGLDPEFAALDRLSEAMARQADFGLRLASAPARLGGAGPDFTRVDIGKLPPGVKGFTMVSTLSGRGVCTRTVEFQSPGEGKSPKVVTRTSGACRADQDPAHEATPAKNDDHKTNPAGIRQHA